MNLPRLVFITNTRASALPVTEALERALGVLPHSSAIVLVREKHLGGRRLFEFVREVRSVTRAHGALLAVSTRIDVALAMDADAVQLGGDAMRFEDARRMSPPNLKLGISLHGDETAPHGADWAFLSPIFPTTSKPGVSPLGLERLKAGSERNRSVPIFALGGIEASNAASCLASGAYGVAVQGAVLTHPQPDVAAARLFESLSSASHGLTS